MNDAAPMTDEAATIAIDPAGITLPNSVADDAKLAVDIRQSDLAPSPYTNPDSARPAHLGLPLLLVLSIGGLLLALAWPMLLGRVYTANDLGDFHLPLRSFYSQQLSRGESFDWCPNLYCGFYLTGEGQVGAYHPLHWLLYRTLPLSLAFDLECWLSYPLMIAGLVLFLRRWHLGREAALFGALVFTFGGFNLLHFVHPNAVAIVAHLPWLLWAIDVMLRSGLPIQHKLAAAATALLTGSQLLLGYPQFVMLSWAVEAGYVVMVTLQKTKSLRSLAADFARWAAAVVMGVLIGGVQLLPTLDAFEHSIRQSTSLGAASVTAVGTSLHPLNMTQLIAPYLFIHRVVGQNTLELSLYCGMAPLVLAVWWLCCAARLQPRFRSLTVLALIAAVCSLLWAFGQWAPFDWLQQNIPGLNAFRLPCRAVFIFQLALAVLAALGFMALAQRNASEPESTRSGHRATFLSPSLWWLLAADIALSALAPWIWGGYVSTWPLILASPLMMSAAIWLVNRAAVGSRWALAALVLFSAIDLEIYGMTSSILDDAQPLANYIRSFDVPSGRPGRRVALDLLSGTEAAPGQKQLRCGDRILLAGWQRVDGYAGLEPARQLDYRQPAALRVAGVSWVSADAAAQIDKVGQRGWLAKPDRRQTTPQEPVVSAGKNTLWLRLGHPQPRAWLATKVISSNHPASDIVNISLSNEALVEPDAALSIPVSEVPGSVSILSDLPGNFVAEVDCPTTQLLVVGESYLAGWQVTIDGKDNGHAKALRVDGDFLGVVAPAGKHEISMKFQSESLYWGRLTSAFGLGLMVVTLLLPGTRCRLRRKSRRTPY